LRITATTVLSYVVCPREAWFMHHQIIPDQNNPFIELGRFVHENSYRGKGEREVELPEMKIDILWKEGDVTVVGEIKKSSRSFKGARVQLLYYMKALKNRGIRIKGYILVPREKKKIEISLGEEEEKEIEELLEEVKKIVDLPAPPKAERKSICDKCGYIELCWA